MKRLRCRTTCMVATFGIGVLLSLVCPSEILLIVTLFALIFVSVC